VHTFKFADNTKMGAAVNTLEGRAAIKKNLYRMEEWADKTFLPWEDSRAVHQVSQTGYSIYALGGFQDATG